MTTNSEGLSHETRPEKENPSRMLNISYLNGVSMSNRSYIEKFDDGPGGWYGWKNNFDGPKSLELSNGAITSRSPWWIDYNHAPPGAGYLHMVFCLHTNGGAPYTERYTELAGINRFLEGGYPTDFTGARLTFRLRGELEARAAQLVLLVQGAVDGLTSGWLLRGRPLEVTSVWSEQAIIADPDPSLWTCLGARHDRGKLYGTIELSSILKRANVNIMLALFPLEIAPMGPLSGDPHRLRAGKDYAVWQSRLPEGYVMLDEVRIDFAKS